MTTFMKYFKPEMVESFWEDNTASQAMKEWDHQCERYVRHLTSIEKRRGWWASRDELQINMRSLHDSQVLEFLNEPCEGHCLLWHPSRWQLIIATDTISMLVDHEAEGKLSMIYKITGPIKYLPPRDGWREREDYRIYWLYDEIRWIKGIYTNNILFDSGAELSIPFTDLKIERIRSTNASDVLEV